MGNGKDPNNHRYRFKKGVSGNPKGRPPITAEFRALRELTLESYRGVIEKVLSGNPRALEIMIADPATPAIQVGIAQAVVNAIKEGDYSVIERIAERIIGKIPDELNVKAQTLNANYNANVSPNGGPVAAATDVPPEPKPLDPLLVKEIVARLDKDF